MAKILIAGCGNLGMALGQQLVTDGHRITGLKRNPPADLENFTFYQADLGQPESLQKLPTDYDLVCVILSPDDRSEACYRRTYVDGLSNLLAHFESTTNSPPFIYVSSSSVYGQRKGEWVDEQSVTRPASFRGEILLQAEALLAANSTRNTVLRFSGIYTQHSQYLLRQAVSGAEIQFSPPSYTNRIHRDDCAGVLKHIAQMKLAGQSTAPLYLCTDDDPAPIWEVLNFLAEREGAVSPTPKHMSADADQNKRCSNALLKQTGYQFRYPSYRDGYANQEE